MDSGILSRVLDDIRDFGGDYVIEQLEEVLTRCAGTIVCDARGIGEDWDHRQLLRITSVLRGTTPQGIVDIPWFEVESIKFRR